MQVLKCQRFSLIVKDSFSNLYLSSEMWKIPRNWARFFRNLCSYSQLVLFVFLLSYKSAHWHQGALCENSDMERCLLNPDYKKSGRLYRIHSSSMFTRVVIFQRPRFVCREFGQRKYISLPMNRQFSKSKNSGKSTFIFFLLFCIKKFKKKRKE